MTDAPVAAIDMGTNSTRLLVHDGEQTLERLMTITRLGQDVDRTGRLADEAIERVITCLRSYKAVMDRFGVQRVRAVATSAARDAASAARPRHGFSFPLSRGLFRAHLLQLQLHRPPKQIESTPRVAALLCDCARQKLERLWLDHRVAAASRNIDTGGMEP